MSLSEQIKQSKDLPREPVPTPEWPDVDGKLFVKKLNGLERVQYDASLEPIQEHPEGQRRFESVVKFVIAATVDEQGEPVFADDDFDWLLEEKDPDALVRIFNAGAALNKMREQDREEIAKNSGSQAGQ